MELIFHFKYTVNCRLQFVSIWTSLKFYRLVGKELNNSLSSEFPVCKRVILPHDSVSCLAKQILPSLCDDLTDITDYGDALAPFCQTMAQMVLKCFPYGSFNPFPNDKF